LEIKKLSLNPGVEKSIRIIADHCRVAVMLISD
jgi:alanyl-tRNA synthetase